jgi:hypothetical protein
VFIGGGGVQLIAVVGASVELHNRGAEVVILLQVGSWESRGWGGEVGVLESMGQQRAIREIACSQLTRDESPDALQQLLGRDPVRD